MDNNTIKTLIIVVIAFLLGIGATLLVRQQPEPEPVPWNDEFLNDMFDDRFFNHSRDPFQEMDRLQQQMDKYFDRSGSRFETMFDDWFTGQFGDYPAASIEMNEDDEHIYYEMDVGSADLTDVQVKVENGMIEINAITQSSPDAGTTSRSEVTQKFPLPDNVDPASVKVTQEGGVITISLAKT